MIYSLNPSSCPPKKNEPRRGFGVHPVAQHRQGGVMLETRHMERRWTRTSVFHIRIIYMYFMYFMCTRLFYIRPRQGCLCFNVCLVLCFCVTVGYLRQIMSMWVLWRLPKCFLRAVVYLWWMGFCARNGLPLLCQGVGSVYMGQLDPSWPLHSAKESYITYGSHFYATSIAGSATCQCLKGLGSAPRNIEEGFKMDL